MKTIETDSLFFVSFRSTDNYRELLFPFHEIDGIEFI